MYCVKTMDLYIGSMGPHGHYEQRGLEGWPRHLELVQLFILCEMVNLPFKPSQLSQGMKKGPIGATFLLPTWWKIQGT